MINFQHNCREREEKERRNPNHPNNQNPKRARVAKEVKERNQEDQDPEMAYSSRNQSTQPIFVLERRLTWRMVLVRKYLVHRLVLM